MRITTSLLLLLSLTLSLSAQDSIKKKESKNPKRTLRVVLVGSRPLPVFEKKGDQYIEVDPPMAVIPPTSFSFANPKHAPKIKVKSNSTPGSGAKSKRKVSYSAWANEFVKIRNYKGPELLPLRLSRPLVSTTDFQKVDCQLGKSINPLILIRRDPSSKGWKSPISQVIDWSPVKHPSASILVVNYSKNAIKLYYAKKSIIISPNGFKHIHPKLNKQNVFRYKIEVSNGKKKMVLANSQYQLNKQSRLIILTLPGTKNKSTPFPLPHLHMIADSMDTVKSTP